jgi:hypothetical protein
MPWPKGKKRPEEFKQQHSKRMKEVHQNRSEEQEKEIAQRLGPKGPRNGISYKHPRQCAPYYKFQAIVRKKNKCQELGCLITTNLDVHHLLPGQFFKKMYEQDINILYDPTLATLYCAKHHSKEDERLRRELAAWACKYK